MHLSGDSLTDRLLTKWTGVSTPLSQDTSVSERSLSREGRRWLRQPLTKWTGVSTPLSQDTPVSGRVSVQGWPRPGLEAVHHLRASEGLPLRGCLSKAKPQTLPMPQRGVSFPFLTFASPGLSGCCLRGPSGKVGGKGLASASVFSQGRRCL
jgi:hypothetical protein